METKNKKKSKNHSFESGTLAVSRLGDTFPPVPNVLTNLEIASPVNTGLVACGARMNPFPAGGEE